MVQISASHVQYPQSTTLLFDIMLQGNERRTDVGTFDMVDKGKRLKDVYCRPQAEPS